MGHYVQFRNQMTNANDEDLMALAKDLFGANSFIVGSGSYQVVQNSPIGMSVLINDGVSYVYSSTLAYHMRTILDTYAVSSSKAVLTIDANSSGSTRYDLICIKIDTAAISDANASNIASLVVVKGTPGAGVPATPANYYKLAEITVADGATTIATAQITDTRSFVYKTLTIPSGSWAPATTSPCATLATVEAGTNDVDYHVLDFDQTTQEYAFIHFDMPDSWDGGTIRFKVKWTAASGTGGVAFSLKGRSYANDDAIDQAYGTEQIVTDTLIAAGDVHETAWSSELTLAGSPAGGQWIQLKLSRVPGNAGDTLNADARLLGVTIEYRQSQYSD